MFFTVILRMLVLVMQGLPGVGVASLLPCRVCSAGRTGHGEGEAALAPAGLDLL